VSQPPPFGTPSPSVHRQARIEALLRKRPRGLSTAAPGTHAAQPTKTITQASLVLTYLHPAVLPNLRTLILTEVPLTVRQSSPIIPALKSFISACADESALALLCAQTNYSLPPGRARHIAELDHARSLFALRTIVLEMAQPVDATKGTEKGWKHSRQRQSMSKSSTGDRDSENLWSAAQNDFSFFGEEGEEEDECGIYQHDPDKYFPTAYLDDKIAVGPEDADRGNAVPNSPHGSFSSATFSSSAFSPLPSSTGSTTLRSPRELPLGRNRRSSNETQRGKLPRSSGTGTASRAKGPPPTSNPTAKGSAEPMVDVVAELAAWRRERKTVYSNEVRRRCMIRGVSGSTSPSNTETSAADMLFVDGYWSGEVKVVRNAAPKGRTGVVDMYGNYFEKGYLYP